MTPTVSVIIPVYNQAQYVAQAIDSVLAQQFTDYEIIVVNDGSTDESPQMLNRYRGRIGVITQMNQGLSAARNSALQIARGEFIGFLDADDLWYPHTLATTVAYLQDHPNIDLVCGAWDLINEAGQIIQPPNNFSAYREKVAQNFLRTIALGNFILPSALLVRRTCFDRCGLFDPDLKGVEDWDFMSRVAAKGCRLGLIDVPVLHYRRHEGCLTRKPERTEKASRQVLDKLFSRPDLAAHLAPDLRDHAFVYAWLSIAGYCQEAGLEAEVRRFVQMAENHYDAAPPEIELSLAYLNRLARLTSAELFMQKIADTTPEARSLFYWLMARRAFERRHYRLGAAYLARLNRPAWLMKKVMLAAARRLPGVTYKSSEEVVGT